MIEQAARPGGIIHLTAVTGATGHVGANLLRNFLARGRQIRALVHVDRRAVEGLNIELSQGDILDIESLYRAFDGVDVVYHLAAHISIAMKDWQSCEAVNVYGTRNVVEACLHCGVRRLVFFSSIHAFKRNPGDMAVDEQCSLVDSDKYPPYDRSKTAAEREVQAGIKRGLDAMIINPTAIVGPFDYGPSYFGRALLLLARHKLAVLVPGGYDWVDVRDVVEGAIRAEEQSPGGAKYILSGHRASLGDIATIVSEIMGVPAPRIVCPMPLARIGLPFINAFTRLSGRQPLYTSVSLKTLGENQIVSHKHATHDLNYQPRPLRETLEDTLSWFKENGYLSCSPEKVPERTP